MPPTSEVSQVLDIIWVIRGYNTYPKSYWYMDIDSFWDPFGSHNNRTHTLIFVHSFLCAVFSAQQPSKSSHQYFLGLLWQRHPSSGNILRDDSGPMPLILFTDMTCFATTSLLNAHALSESNEKYLFLSPQSFKTMHLISLVIRSKVPHYHSNKPTDHCTSHRNTLQLVLCNTYIHPFLSNIFMRL